MLNAITRCANCGAELEVPCDTRDADDLWRVHCEDCNDRFVESMRAEFPHGQCATCGGAYSPVASECGRCWGEGEVVVLDGAGYQWGACGLCGGTGALTILSAMHEETLCGFPDGEGRWEPRPTHVEQLAWMREERAERASRTAAAAAWRANLSGYAAAVVVDDLAFLSATRRETR
jgi:hypothetical protein